jgi:flagellar basal-body rod modification protein FlgD
MSAITNPLASVPSQNTGTGNAASSSATQGAGNNQLTGASFIQLLTAQLQAQNPLNPVDPSSFVTQLVQFNQLEQLIDINQTLSQSAASSAASSTPGTTQNASMQGNPGLVSPGKS